MATNIPYSLEAAIESRGCGTQELSPAFFSNLADRLEEALAGHSKETIVGLSAQLIQLFNCQFRAVLPDVRDAVRGKGSAPREVVQAFNLGQIGFAQAFVAQAAERRADDDFVRVLGKPSFAPYLNALSEREMTCQELAQVTRTQPETVSRNLKRLRELGVADFMKDGRSVYNFLTPVARAALPAIGKPIRRQDVPSVSLEKSNVVVLKERLKLELSDHLQMPPSFQPDRLPLRAYAK